MTKNNKTRQNGTTFNATTATNGITKSSESQTTTLQQLNVQAEAVAGSESNSTTLDSADDSITSDTAKNSDNWLLSQTNSLGKLRLPALFYDLTLLTVIAPFHAYLWTYLFKRGRFNYYLVPLDLIEISVSDLTALFLAILALTFALTLPLYPILPYFFPVALKNESKKILSDRILMIVVGLELLVVAFILMTTFFSIDRYWRFIGENFGLCLLAFTGLITFLSVLFKGKFQQKELDVKSSLALVAGVVIFLFFSSAVAQNLGTYFAKNQITYDTVCGNYFRIARAGDKTIVKKVDRSGRTFDNTYRFLPDQCQDEEQFFTREDMGPLTPVLTPKQLDKQPER